MTALLPRLLCSAWTRLRFERRGAVGMSAMPVGQSLWPRLSLLRVTHLCNGQLQLQSLSPLPLRTAHICLLPSSHPNY